MKRENKLLLLESVLKQQARMENKMEDMNRLWFYEVSRDKNSIYQSEINLIHSFIQGAPKI